MREKAISMYKTFKTLFLLLATNTSLCSGKQKENEGSNSTVIIIAIFGVLISGLAGLALCSFQKAEQNGEKEKSESVEIDKNDDEDIEADSTEQKPGKAEKKSTKSKKSNKKAKLKSELDSDVKNKKADKSKKAKSKKDKKMEKNKSKVSEELVLNSSSKTTATDSKSSESLPSATGLKNGGSAPAAVERLKRAKVTPVKRSGTEEILPISNMPSVIPAPGSKI